MVRPPSSSRAARVGELRAAAAVRRLSGQAPGVAPDAAVRAAFLRDWARSHPPPALDRLTVAQRRALLGDAYLGDWHPPAVVAKHGDKGTPGYVLLHPGPLAGPLGSRRRNVPGQEDMFAQPEPAPPPVGREAELAALRSDIANLGSQPDEPAVTAIGERIVNLAIGGDETERQERLKELMFKHLHERSALSDPIALGELEQKYLEDKRVLEQRGEAVLAVLGELRPMGQPLDAKGAPRKVRVRRGSTPKALVQLNKVSRWFPTDWLDRHDAGPTMAATVVKSRAHYVEKKYTEGQGVHSVLWTQAGNLSTTLHEFTHRMEHVVPGISGLEMAFWRRRTADGRGQRSYLGSDERVSPDEFADEYIGKSYLSERPETRGGPIDPTYLNAVGINVEDRSPEQRASGRFWEVASMGMEGLVFDKAQVWDKDRDHINFMAGLLASAGRPATNPGGVT